MLQQRRLFGQSVINLMALRTRLGVEHRRLRLFSANPVDAPSSKPYQQSKQRRIFFGKAKDEVHGNKELIAMEELKFTQVPPDRRNKDTFMGAIHIYINNREKSGRGCVEFIYAALKHLKPFGLHKDLDTYKALINVFPKGPLIPTNIVQRKHLHFPQEQVCCVTLLDQMEWFGCQPDKEVHDMVVNVFGDWNYSTKKIKRMLYWMPKLKHTNHYLDRRDVEHKSLNAMEIARAALKMMCRDSGTQFTYLKTAGPVETERRWIVSAQSPLQQHIIASQLPASRSTYYVDGPNFVRVMDNRVLYCVLSSDPMVKADEEFIDQRDNYSYNPADLLRSVDEEENRYSMHQQSDQTILAMAVMEEQKQAIATAWINHLQARNPAMEGANVLFRIKEPKEVSIDDERQDHEDDEEDFSP